MCRICQGKISLDEYTLDCSYCPHVTEIPVLKKLTILYCIGCTSLTKICNSPKLEKINCSHCPLLTDIPVINSLKMLSCEFCPLIKIIPSFPDLLTIMCNGCENLTEISDNPNLLSLDCSGCNLLIKIPNHIVEFLYCTNCPFLPQNPNNKISQGLKLQRWIKNNFRYFVFLKWINSQEGKEFLYHPGNIGGRIEKSKMKKVLLSLSKN